MILRLLEDEPEFSTKKRKKHKNTHKKILKSPTFWGEFEYLQELKKAGSEAFNILLVLHYSSQDSQPHSINVRKILQYYPKWSPYIT